MKQVKTRNNNKKQWKKFSCNFSNSDDFHSIQMKANNNNSNKNIE